MRVLRKMPIFTDITKAKSLSRLKQRPRKHAYETAIIKLSADNMMSIYFPSEHSGTYISTPLKSELSLESIEDQLKAIAKQLHQTNASISRAIIALESSYTLAGRISNQNLGKSLSLRARKQALLYRFEEQVPVDVEDLCADYVSLGKDNLGIALKTDSINKIVDTFESIGFLIDLVVPWSFLIIQSTFSNSNNNPDVVMVQERDGWAWVEMKNHKPSRHHRIPNHQDSMSLRAELFAKKDIQETHICLLTENDDRLSLFADIFGKNIRSTSLRIDIDNLSNFVQQCTRGIKEPWINLRTGSLASTDPIRRVRKYLNTALLSLILLLIICAASMWTKGRQYAELTDTLASKQSELYLQALPGRIVPSNPAYRLESEVRQLVAITGQDASQPQLFSGLEILYEVMRRLPRKLRYRITEIRIDQDRLLLQGEARSHSQADILASALRTQSGFSIEPPRTEQLRTTGVSFTLTSQVEPDHDDPEESDLSSPAGETP